MASTQDAQFAMDRNNGSPKKSKGVLKSFMQHKKTPSEGSSLPPVPPSPSYPIGDIYCGGALFDPNRLMLPDDHPHARALGELPIHINAMPPPSKPAQDSDSSRPKSRGVDGDNQKPKSLHKKTLSSYSLKNLAGKDKSSPEKSSQPKDEKSNGEKAFKSISKSSKNLANLLRVKSSKSLQKDMEGEAKYKENRAPPSSRAPPVSYQEPRTPIYAQFSSQPPTGAQVTRRSVEEEIALYTPSNYGPSNQRNFHDGIGYAPAPQLQQDGKRSRPTSWIRSSVTSQDVSRQASDNARRSREEKHSASGDTPGRPPLNRKITPLDTGAAQNFPKKGSRVAAATAAIEGQFSTRSSAETSEPPTPVDPKEIETEFEAMLDRRNIPENQRFKMRSVALSMKMDLVRQDRAELLAAKNRLSRPPTQGSEEDEELLEEPEQKETKSKRPRSMNFTFGRKDKDPSPTKKSKPEGNLNITRHMRSKSTVAAPTTPKSPGGTGIGFGSQLLAKAKGQLPDDFVAYLRKTPEPAQVEVGKLHKLMLLLRNETVSWTECYIGLGGMTEIVALLHRIMEVEWREEHEDQLLHETLLCLKALCTTALGLTHLTRIQSTLFPALIGMLFDPEHKGPSEFSTRSIITWLLYTWLQSSPQAERAHRARTLLSYLHDPSPPEAERPLAFVIDMWRDRPYRVWCKEVSSVTKEVFWIFLHSLNVIAVPKFHEDGSSSEFGRKATEQPTVDEYAYMKRHFPSPAPPVAAAPYVGGVEWEATNYLSSHLDILNGIIASLPSKEERNKLREELRVSGWEKVLGGTLRLCKEKFYGGVHESLRCWVGAAVEDGCDAKDVRYGPKDESPRKMKSSPVKNNGGVPKLEAPRIETPRLEIPRLELGGDVGAGRKKSQDDGGWLEC